MTRPVTNLKATEKPKQGITLSKDAVSSALLLSGTIMACIGAGAVWGWGAALLVGGAMAFVIGILTGIG